MDNMPRELSPQDIAAVDGGLSLTPILTAFTLFELGYDFCKGVAAGYASTAN